MKPPHLLLLVLAPIFVLLVGGQSLPLPPVSRAEPEVKSSQAIYRTRGGREAMIVVAIPGSNLTALRFPSVYTQRYFNGYLASWNDQVFQRQMSFRAFDGQFKRPSSEKNFHLYDGEQFDLETLVHKEQLAASTPIKNKPDAFDAFSLSDATTASSSGREDGRRAAKQDFVRSMLSKEIHS